jgi:hypothetical protein
LEEKQKEEPDVRTQRGEKEGNREEKQPAMTEIKRNKWMREEVGNKTEIQDGFHFVGSAPPQTPSSPRYNSTWTSRLYKKSYLGSFKQFEVHSRVSQDHLAVVLVI